MRTNQNINRPNIYQGIDMRNGLERIATVVSGFLGGYWLIVLVGGTKEIPEALYFTILWLLILAVLRNF